MANIPEPRFGIIPLPISNKDEAVKGEMLTDSNTGHIYFKNDDGEIISKTVELEKRIEMLELMAKMSSSDISISGGYLYDLYSKDKNKHEKLEISTGYISSIKSFKITNISPSVTAGVFIPIPLLLIKNEVYYFILNEVMSVASSYTRISLKCVDKNGDTKNVSVRPIFKNIDNGDSLNKTHSVVYKVNTKNIIFDSKDYTISGVYLFVPPTVTTDVESIKIVRENVYLSSRVNNDIVITPDFLTTVSGGNIITSDLSEDSILGGTVIVNLLELNLLEEQYALDIQYESLSAYKDDNIADLYLNINNKSVSIGKYDLNNISGLSIHTFIECKFSRLLSKYNISDDNIYKFTLEIDQITKSGGEPKNKASISSITLSKISGAAYKTETTT